jgi:hypothetical protein
VAEMPQNGRSGEMRRAETCVGVWQLGCSVCGLGMCVVFFFFAGGYVRGVTGLSP